MRGKKEREGGRENGVWKSFLEEINDQIKIVNCPIALE